MKYPRQTPRLKDFDYKQPDPYFVTTVTHSRDCLFGKVIDAKMQLNEFGQIVAETWQWLGNQYPSLVLGESIVMPNHFHGILTIIDPPCSSGRSRPAATVVKMSLGVKPLGQLVVAFKTMSAKRINLLRGTPGYPVWQRGFYERIVCDTDELTHISQYIQDNPVNWPADNQQSL